MADYRDFELLNNQEFRRLAKLAGKYADLAEKYEEKKKQIAAQLEPLLKAAGAKAVDVDDKVRIERCHSEGRKQFIKAKALQFMSVAELEACYKRGEPTDYARVVRLDKSKGAEDESE